MPKEMENDMISFVNSFLSYLVLLLVIVAVAGIGLTLGIVLRKKKNGKN